MRNPRPFLFGALLVMTTFGCSRDSRANRVILWEGEAACEACRSSAVVLWPGGPSRLSLRTNSQYTAELEMRPSGNPDNCVYKFVSNTWSVPSPHVFDCEPEQEIMHRTFSTQRLDVREHDVLSLRVSVLSISQAYQPNTPGQLLVEQHFDVDWIP